MLFFSSSPGAGTDCTLYAVENAIKFLLKVISVLACYADDAKQLL